MHELLILSVARRMSDYGLAAWRRFGPDDQMAFDVYIDEKLQQLKNAATVGVITAIIAVKH